MPSHVSQFTIGICRQKFMQETLSKIKGDTCVIGSYVDHFYIV